MTRAVYIYWKGEGVRSLVPMLARLYGYEAIGNVPVIPGKRSVSLRELCTGRSPSTFAEKAELSTQFLLHTIPTFLFIAYMI